MAGIGGVEIELGGKVRTLKFTTEAMLAAQRLLPNNMSVREALGMHRDVGIVVTCAAAALLHEDRKISPKRICNWLDREPKKAAELEAKVVEAAMLALRAFGQLEDEDEDEEVPGPLASGSSS